MHREMERVCPGAGGRRPERCREEERDRYRRQLVEEEEAVLRPPVWSPRSAGKWGRRLSHRSLHLL